MIIERNEKQEDAEKRECQVKKLMAFGKILAWKFVVWSVAVEMLGTEFAYHDIM